MRGRARVVTSLAAAGFAAAAAAGPPALLAQARYVALGYDTGAGFVSENPLPSEVLPEEHQALQRIRSGLEAWGRYVIVLRPEQADLLIAIRKGRLASLGGGVHVGGSRGRPEGGPVGLGPLAGVQLSSPDDMIEIFDARGGNLVWRGMKANGLSGDGPPLFDSLRADVAKADKATPKRD